MQLLFYGYTLILTGMSLLSFGMLLWFCCPVALKNDLSHIPLAVTTLNQYIPILIDILYATAIMTLHCLCLVISRICTYVN